MAGLIAVVAVLLVAIVALRRLRGATVYVSHPYGYRAVSFGADTIDKLRPVSRERYERILARFVDGDLFDELWVSLVQDPYGGVVLSNEGEETEMSLSFRSLREPERLAEFRERMASFGYVPSAEHPWNVGLGVDSESLRLEYRLATDLDGIRKASDLALEALQGESIQTTFVHAWRRKDGPRGVGITVRLPRDFLTEVP